MQIVFCSLHRRQSEGGAREFDLMKGHPVYHTVTSWFIWIMRRPVVVVLGVKPLCNKNCFRLNNVFKEAEDALEQSREFSTCHYRKVCTNDIHLYSSTSFVYGIWAQPRYTSNITIPHSSIFFWPWDSCHRCIKIYCTLHLAPCTLQASSLLLLVL